MCVLPPASVFSTQKGLIQNIQKGSLLRQPTEDSLSLKRIFIPFIRFPIFPRQTPEKRVLSNPVVLVRQVYRQLKRSEAEMRAELRLLEARLAVPRSRCGAASVSWPTLPSGPKGSMCFMGGFSIGRCFRLFFQPQVGKSPGGKFAESNEGVLMVCS